MKPMPLDRRALQTRHVIIVHVLLTLFGSSSLYGQCGDAPDLQSWQDNEAIIAPLDASGQIDSSKRASFEQTSAFYDFQYCSDSSKLSFSFGEFAINGRKITLADWCYNRLVNWDDPNKDARFEWTPEELRSRSRSSAFTLSFGDTIQFYRTWWITDGGTNDITSSRYVNDNLVSYSVELVDHATNTRVAVLDSVDFGLSTENRRPWIDTWYPPISRVIYTAGGSRQKSNQAYIRVNMYDKSARPRPFVRVDRFDFATSDRELQNAQWLSYNESTMTGRYNASSSSMIGCQLRVQSVPSARGISITNQSAVSSSTIQIADVQGQVVWKSENLPVNTDVIAPTGPGLFIVSARSGELATCSQTVVVPGNQ